MKKKQTIKICIALAVAAIIGITLLAVLGTGKQKEQEMQNAQPPIPAVETALDKAKAANPDTVAWLTVPNTDIDNAVMQTTDNEHYLQRDERGEKNIWGSYFADYYANLTAPSSLIQNTVIYGHTENNDNPDGQKFSQLFRYTDIDFLRKNPNITLTVDNKKLTFNIFGVFYTDIDFYYIDPNPSDQGFDNFMQEVNTRNEFIFEGNTVTEKDRLLTLSGCSHKYDVKNTRNHRFVVMAKLVEDGSSPDTIIQQNPNPKHP